MEGFSSASLFLARKWKTVIQGVTKGIDHSTRRITQEANLVKGWEVRELTLMLFLFYMNVSGVCLGFLLPAFDDTGSLGSPHQVVYPPGSTLGNCLMFPCRD